MTTYEQNVATLRRIQQRMDRMQPPEYYDYDGDVTEDEEEELEEDKVSKR